jgi:hypothetical protein
MFVKMRTCELIEKIDAKVSKLFSEYNSKKYDADEKCMAWSRIQCSDKVETFECTEAARWACLALKDLDIVNGKIRELDTWKRELKDFTEVFITPEELSKVRC